MASVVSVHGNVPWLWLGRTLHLVMEAINTACEDGTCLSPIDFLGLNGG